MKLYFFYCFLQKRHKKIRTLSSILQIMLFFISILFFNVKLYGNSSKFLKMEKEKEIPVMFYSHIDNIEEQNKPKFIHHVDTFYYKQNKKIYQKGILFTINSYSAKNVYFTSNLDNYKRHPMRRNNNGVWYYVLPIKQAKRYATNNKIEYHFLIDNIFIHDKSNDQFIWDQFGKKISIFYLDDSMDIKENIILTEKTKDKLKVTFQIYAPNVEQISIIGNFNFWNPNMDIMQKEKENTFTVEKYIEKHKKYYYLFFIDGNYVLDKNNTCVEYHKVYGPVSCYSFQSN